MNTTGDKLPDENKKTSMGDFHHDKNQINDDDRKANDQFHKCNFNDFISDKKTPKLAKEIFLGNNWDLIKEGEALALLDSLKAKNKEARAFYFKVVTKAFKKSDGYFAEALGLAGKEYVENNTLEFISNFDNKACFTEQDLTTWAKIVMLELSLDTEENEYDKPVILDFVKKLKFNCNKCDALQKENMHLFGLILQNE